MAEEAQASRMVAECSAILCVGVWAFFWASSYAWGKMRLTPTTFIISFLMCVASSSIFCIAAVLEMFSFEAAKIVFAVAIVILIIVLVAYGLFIYRLWQKTIGIEKKH